MWMLSVALFLVGSTLCGLAWSTESLIVFRVLQGFGGGMILPVGQAILAQAAGPQRMGRVMSVIGVPTLLGPILGPVIGGLIVDNVSWRWIFFVNMPVGRGGAGAGRPDPAAPPSRGTRLAASTSRPAAALAGAGAAGLRALRVRHAGTVSRGRCCSALGAGVLLIALFVLARRARGGARADRLCGCSATARSRRPPGRCSSSACRCSARC